MAKLSYGKPAIKFQAIPMVVGGGTGCFYETTSAPYDCRVYDEVVGWIFSDSAGSNCEVISEGNFCYSVPIADSNVYNS